MTQSSYRTTIFIDTIPLWHPPMGCNTEHGQCKQLSIRYPGSQTCRREVPLNAAGAFPTIEPFACHGLRPRHLSIHLRRFDPWIASRRHRSLIQLLVMMTFRHLSPSQCYSPFLSLETAAPLAASYTLQQTVSTLVEPFSVVLQQHEELRSRCQQLHPVKNSDICTPLRWVPRHASVKTLSCLAGSNVTLH